MDSPKEKEEFYLSADCYMEAVELLARLLPRKLTASEEDEAGVTDVIIDSDFSEEVQL